MNSSLAQYNLTVMKSVMLFMLIALNCTLPTLPLETDIRLKDTPNLVKFRDGDSKVLQWSYIFKGDEQSKLHHFSCGYHDSKGVYVPLAIDLSGESKNCNL